MGKLTILKAGQYDTIQDQGRFGYRKWGVPVSGAMDKQSAMLANSLVNNDANTAVIEITLTGPSIEFNEVALIAICGADLSPEIDQNSIAMNRAIAVEKGSKLSFGKRLYGTRAYLAIYGLECEKVLGSHSQFSQITVKNKIEVGDTFKYSKRIKIESGLSKTKIERELFEQNELSVIQGPEYNLLSQNQKNLLVTNTFVIGINNRMGYQIQKLDGLQNEFQIITSNTITGTVQLTPEGRLIVLMADGQVTGGYPRVLQLTEKSINILAQKANGGKIKFLINNF